MSRPKRSRGDRTGRPGWSDDPHARPPEDTDAFAEADEEGGSPGFICAHCGGFVPEAAFGTGQRNHCPHCLWSLHVDIKPGDRRSLCASQMEPVAVWVADAGEWRLIHRCAGCGVLKPNRIAGDDSDDAIDAIVAKLARPRPRDPHPRRAEDRDE